jgi:hypothetical protein
MSPLILVLLDDLLHRSGFGINLPSGSDPGLYGNLHRFFFSFLDRPPSRHPIIAKQKTPARRLAFLLGLMRPVLARHHFSLISL